MKAHVAIHTTGAVLFKETQMKSRTMFAVALSIAIAAGATPLDLARYTSTKSRDSQITITGTSTLHAWACQVLNH